MKHFLVFALIMASSIGSFAEGKTKTVSQKISDQMVAALNSSEIQEALSVEDGLGTLKSVAHFQPRRADPSTARVEITFLSHGPGGLQKCTVNVYVNVYDNSIVRVDKVSCSVDE